MVYPNGLATSRMTYAGESGLEPAEPLCIFITNPLLKNEQSHDPRLRHCTLLQAPARS